MAELGTVKTEFNRAYVYLNPDPYAGPNTWRLSNVVPIDGPGPEGGLKEVYTLLPIDKTDIGTTTNLFFNIAGLPDTRSASTRSDYISHILGTFTAELPALPKRSTFNLKGVVGVPPIQTVIADDAAIVYFDVNNLPTLETVRSHRLYNISPSTLKYNSRSVDVLTADVPLESVTANGTATVSLDFRNLPEA